MELDARQTLVLAILTLFLGKFLNSKIVLFRTYNLPEPVTGGVTISLLIGAFYFLGNWEISFDLAGRDALLIVFFTTIGLNSKIRTLLAGGKPLLILLGAAIVYLMLQNATGIAVALATGLPKALGVLGGSISLSGGHGTAIAWAPKLAEDYGITDAAEIGIACATFGLILGGVIGGPVANFLITRHRLSSTHLDEENIVGLPNPDCGKEPESPAESRVINIDSVLGSLLVIAVAIGLGMAIGEGLRAWVGLDLPDFVVCLFAGILLTNIIGPRFNKIGWPTGTNSLALVSDLSLGLFLAMSLMSLQLWTLIDLAGPIMAMLLAQVVVMVLWAVFVIFRLMGKTYDAAVIAAGYCGLGLGATPTAIANMSAVTKKSGPSPQAFLIVPLVGAFFIDLANAFIIQFFLGQPG